MGKESDLQTIQGILVQAKVLPPETATSESAQQPPSCRAGESPSPPRRLAFCISCCQVLSALGPGLGGVQGPA